MAEKGAAPHRTAERQEERRGESGVATGFTGKIDWYAFVVAFKGVVLEGLEIAFIVVTFGAEANQVGWSIAGAIAALAVIGGIAFLIRGWLSRIPREWLRFAVGILLAAFGTFWAGEGALVRWPGGDLALLELLGIMAATAFAYLALLRHNAAMIRPDP